MSLTIELTGLNTEKLLSLAAQEGVIVRHARRLDARTLRLQIAEDAKPALDALCERYGWEARVVSYGMLLRTLMACKRQPTRVMAVLLCVGLVRLSSSMIWRISIENAGKNIGEIRRYLKETGMHEGAFKAKHSLKQMREALMLRLPDLVYVGTAYEGSTLIIDCQNALEGELAQTGGDGLHLAAAQDALITGMAVQSGTPQVSIGQAVRKGDLLILGEERGEKQSVHSVQAQGTVNARVWARGDARVALRTKRTVETGATRQRVTVCTPWSRRVVCDAQPFAAQDVSMSIEPVVGLYIPLWREVETLAEIEVMQQKRSEETARDMALEAAEQMAKKQCPPGTQILDKTVNYSMIDNEYVYATVVLEYEQNIAVRADTARSGP